MKKIVLLVCIAAVMVLSGCLPYIMPGPEVFNTVPNTELSENITAKMKSNAAGRTFEGFNGQSTFTDVFNNTDMKKIKRAELVYNAELLGYPAVMQCSFTNYKGSLLLDHLYFNIIFRYVRTEDISEEKLAAKLDAELGERKKYTDEEAFTEYSWEKDGWHTNMSFFEDDYSGGNAAISIYPPMVIGGRLPKIPDMFPYQFGTDINTVLSNETPSVLPEDYSNYSSIHYDDGGIDVILQFTADETGAIRLCRGSYNVSLNGMTVKDSLDYYETLADGIEAAMGKPEARGYGIWEVEEEPDGSISLTSGGTEGGGRGLTKQDILDANAKYYWLEMNWPGVDFWADYDMGATVNIDYSEEYFGGEADE